MPPDLVGEDPCPELVLVSLPGFATLSVVWFCTGDGFVFTSGDAWATAPFSWVVLFGG